MYDNKLLKDQDLELVSGGEDFPIPDPDVPGPVDPSKKSSIECPKCHETAIYYRELFLKDEKNSKRCYKCFKCVADFYIEPDGKVVYISGPLF